jgi:L-glutamine-phosphate cytidylyltransferase
MQALILAAGQGRRLLPLTKDTPKCLLKFGDITLLEIQAEQCRRLGLEKIWAVIGFKEEDVRRIMGDKISYISNKDYMTTNSLYSFWLARQILTTDTLIMNSDVIVDDEIIVKLMDSEQGDLLAADFRTEFQEEDMKIAVDSNLRLLSISKTLGSEKAKAENLGVLKLSIGCIRQLINVVEPIIDASKREFFPYALDLLAPTVEIGCLPVGNLPWIEIDFPEDYQKALREVFPRISSKHIAGQSHLPVERITQEICDE